ncbi:COX assembly mitochondrial protein homolog [Uranotaenia lowii]|uniref:COX assembly mitochondrial protein homolog n=1 Tax=Uranotaenia lowii TaxID=190385 RepID=UPI002478C924|nr:COX assembly mitochondrial protein homolog [Uranotaenia lowii]
MSHVFSDAPQPKPAGISQGGPHGLGDPDDRRLRKVEVEVMIPKIMRERAKVEKCIPEVSQFEACCKESGLWMATKCQKQNETMKDCFTRWYKNEEFVAECRESYLKERSEFRRTGIPKKLRNVDSSQ